MNKTQHIRQGLKIRNRREQRFKLYGITAIGISFAFLIFLVSDITLKALPAITQTWIQLDIEFDPQRLGIEAGTKAPDELANGNFRSLVKHALKSQFPTVKKRRDKRRLIHLLSSNAEYRIRDTLIDSPLLLGTRKSLWVLADDDVDLYVKSGSDIGNRLHQSQRTWVDQLKAQGRIEQHFNWTFLSNGDSREPEQAGIASALIGSLLTLLVTLSISFPIAVATAVYLEEFAPKNRITDFIEVNINNLAAVPSIVFGLLGLAVFINFFGLPRSAPLVGGIVLSLMTLPTIIIAARAALKSVPPSIREAALGLGASKMQMVFHHALPLAMPGILTGTIIGMAQALGETAPLLMIGMVAFIVDIPQTVVDSSTALPVQIFLWADSPERAFIARTSAAILVLIAFLITMNTFAIWLRKRLERKW